MELQAEQDYQNRARKRQKQSSVCISHGPEPPMCKWRIEKYNTRLGDFGQK